jgi:beta-glucosidase
LKIPELTAAARRRVPRGEPFKRLVAWEKVKLSPGEIKTVTFTLEPQYLSIFNTEKDGWELLPGDYQILAGPSSSDTPLRASARFH